MDDLDSLEKAGDDDFLEARLAWLLIEWTPEGDY
jgi:hypothetical protein